MRLLQATLTLQASCSDSHIAMSCKITFTFLKGPCLGQVITHHFEKHSTVAQMKQFLADGYHAYDPSTQSLIFVWDQQLVKLTDDAQTASSFGEEACITVSTHHARNAVEARVASSAQIADPSSMPTTIHNSASSSADAAAAAATAAAPPPPAAATAVSAHSSRHPTALPLPSQTGFEAGSRVLIGGLQAKPEMNGRTGVIVGPFNSQTQRWHVLVNAECSQPSCHGYFRTANLSELAAASPGIKMPLPIPVTRHGSNSTLHSRTKEGKNFRIEMPTRLFKQLEPYMASCCARNPGLNDHFSNFFGVQHASKTHDALKEGVCVRIEGCCANTELNGMTGVIFGQINPASGQFTIRIDTVDTKQSLDVELPPENLKVIPKHNPSKEWLDENGEVCPKSVDFLSQCPKGHTLKETGRGNISSQLLCRICHSYSSDSDEAARWLTCSVAHDCCGGYAVCDRCSVASPIAHDTSNQSGNFCFLVQFHSTHACNLPLTSCAGRRCAVHLMAAFHTCACSQPHHHVPVLPNVHQTTHVTQLQRPRK